MGKYYTFMLQGYVYAESKEEALQMVEDGEYEDITDKCVLEDFNSDSRFLLDT